MGAVKVSKQGSPVDSAEEMAGRFYGERIGLLPNWKRLLRGDPGQLETLERDAHTAFARGADLLVAGLLAVVMKTGEFEGASERTRQAYRLPLARGRTREIRVRLLGGLVIWISSLYCAPRKRLFREPVEEVPGLNGTVDLKPYDSATSSLEYSSESTSIVMISSVAVRRPGSTMLKCAPPSSPIDGTNTWRKRGASCAKTGRKTGNGTCGP